MRYVSDLVMAGAPSHRLRLAAWLGPLLALAGLVSYFTLAVRVPALRDSAALNLVLVGVGLGLSLWAVSARWSLRRAAGAVVALLCAGLLGAYVFALSASLPESGGVVAVGEAAPDFALVDHRDRVVSLEDLRGSSVVLVFYRGFW